jgi:transcriptional regulator with XRE-family HTH domain
LAKEKKEYPYSDFGKRIKKCREEKNMDMKTYAEITKIKESSLYKYEQGKIFPPIENFMRICKALDVTPSYLLLPLLKLDPPDEDLINIWKKIKEWRENKDTWEIVKHMIMSMDIYLHTLTTKK